MTLFINLFYNKKYKHMKDRFQVAALVIVMIIMNLIANGQSLNNTMISFNRVDSLFQLQKNYPPVYNHLLNEFKHVKELHYSVKGNTLFISFTSDEHKILSVYSASGRFRHSIADIGIALPHLITEQLKKEYPAYSVCYGKEIRAHNQNTYQVLIENKSEYRLINFFDTEMEEVKRLKK